MGMSCAILVCLLSVAASASAGPRCLSVAPVPYHVDVEAGVYFTATEWNIYARGLASGRLLWSRQAGYRTNNELADFGKDVVLFESEQGFVGVDKKTGRERWKQTERAWGKFYSVKYLGNSGWIAAKYEQAYVVYAPGGRRRERLPPCEPGKNMEIIGWLEEGETLVLAQSETQSGFPCRTSIYLWDLEHEPCKACDLDGVDWRSVRDVLPPGRSGHYRIRAELPRKQVDSTRCGKRRVAPADGFPGGVLRLSQQPVYDGDVVWGFVPPLRYRKRGLYRHARSAGSPF